MLDEQQKQHLQQLQGLIKDYPSAMLSTISPEGWVRSRPMMTRRNGNELDLWFASAYDTDKVHDIEGNPRVGVTYHRGGELFYVSVSGSGEIVRDRERIRQLWDPGWQEWFPNGPDDPNLALVKVNAEHVEYWDERSGRVVVLFTKASRQRGEPQERKLG